MQYNNTGPVKFMCVQFNLKCGIDMAIHKIINIDKIGGKLKSDDSVFAVVIKQHQMLPLCSLFTHVIEN